MRVVILQSLFSVKYKISDSKVKYSYQLDKESAHSFNGYDKLATSKAIFEQQRFFFTTPFILLTIQKKNYTWKQIFFFSLVFKYDNTHIRMHTKQLQSYHLD